MSPDELLERTQWDLFWLPSDARPVERPDLAYSWCPADRPVLNCVVRTRLAAADVAGALPLGLAAALAGAGYEPGPEHRAVVLPVRGPRVGARDPA